MVLFFTASSLFHEVKDIDKKEFSTEIVEKEDTEVVEKNTTPKFKLLDKAY